MVENLILLLGMLLPSKQALLLRVAMKYYLPPPTLLSPTLPQICISGTPKMRLLLNFYEVWYIIYLTILVLLPRVDNEGTVVLGIVNSIVIIVQVTCISLAVSVVI